MNKPLLKSNTIRVDVDFYPGEKAKLLHYPTADKMRDLVSKPLKIPTAEFLTYYFFHRIKTGRSDYQDYASVKSKIRAAHENIVEFIDYEYGSVRTSPEVSKQLPYVSEHVGEAIGLAVMNRIHDLTEADWVPIPEPNGSPIFDFQIASDGKSFIQLEAKGSSVDDNQKNSSAVRQQKFRIAQKKAKLKILDKEKRKPYPASLRYGTITAVDPRTDGDVRCLLVDPPAEQFNHTPRKFRLLNRMRFLHQWISFISPRSALATALATRIADLEVLKNPFELDGVPLRGGNGDPFEIEIDNSWSGSHSAFMTFKSQVTDDPAGGVVVRVTDQELFFLGIREALLTVAEKQDFETLNSYKANVDSIEKTVDCTFSAGRYDKLNLPQSVKSSAKKTGGYVRFRLQGNLNYSPAGLVFGVLPLPEE